MDAWTLIGVTIMAVLLLVSLAQVKKIDDKVAECNQYWIDTIDSGRVDYYGEMPDNFTTNYTSNVPAILKEAEEVLEVSNDY